MNIDERIKMVMSSIFDIDVKDISDDSSPDSIGSWDSLHHMNLIVALEEEFGITFNEDDISNMLNYKLIRLTLSEYESRK
jgi:acyl carrier protein